jgi:hypothetical protein
MADQQIGTFVFDTWRGQIYRPAEQIAVLDVRGRDGHRTRAEGSKAQPSQIETVTVADTLAAAETLRDSYYDAVGDRVDVTDAIGSTHEDCDILMVECRLRNIIYQGAAKVAVMSRWLLRMQA